MLKVNLDQLITDWHWPRFRTTKRLELVKNFITPIKALYNDFVAFADATMKAVTYNCQVIQLERLLNDYYYSTYSAWDVAHAYTAGDIVYYAYTDVNGNYTTWIYKAVLNSTGQNPYHNTAYWSRSIYIENTYLDYNANYIYRESDGITPLYLYRTSDAHADTFIYRNADYLDTYDFIVHLPAGLSSSDTITKALINKYRKAGKRFKIQHP